jgi:hypothetical protein
VPLAPPFRVVYYPDMSLDTRPARNDLTSRECAKLIGGLLASLCEQASIEEVKEAVDSWSRNQTVWDAFRRMKAYYTEHQEVDVLMTFDPMLPKS